MVAGRCKSAPPFTLVVKHHAESNICGTTNVRPSMSVLLVIAVLASLTLQLSMKRAWLAVLLSPLLSLIVQVIFSVVLTHPLVREGEITNTTVALINVSATLLVWFGLALRRRTHRKQRSESDA